MIVTCELITTPSLILVQEKKYPLICESSNQQRRPRTSTHVHFT
jgi:hypothetical protein